MTRLFLALSLCVLSVWRLPEQGSTERLQFTSDAAIVTYFVRSGVVDAFKRTVDDWHDKAIAAQDPQTVAQLRGWRLYQAAERGPRDSVVMMSVIYPVIAGADYTLPGDVGTDILVGLSSSELVLVEDFSKDTPLPVAGTSSVRPAAAAGSPFVLSSDAAVLTLFVKSERTGGFEEVARRVHSGLTKSRDRARLEQAAGWRLFRSREPGPNKTVMYLSLIAPVVKGAEYSVPQILQEAYPQDVQQLLPQYRDALAGMSQTELTLVKDFAAPARPAPNAPSQ